jgi:hypothetical protein
MASYIYLLKEREFIKTNEEIYKIGKTRQNNGERFKQYPKGSILILQKICSDCDKMEKIILKKFKEQFKQRKDIGAEYFEGNCNDMCKEIEDTINGETDNCSEDELSTNEFSEEENDFTIDTYEKLIQFTCIQKIVIVRKTKFNGFLKSSSGWRVIKDSSEKDFNEKNDETLDDWIKHNVGLVVINKITKEISKLTGQIKEICIKKRDEFDKKYQLKNATYDLEKIKKDVLKKCYDKTAKPYDLKYHEYVITKSECVFDTCYDVVFDLASFGLTDVTSDKIILKRQGLRYHLYPNIDSDINIEIINEIFIKMTNNIKKVKEFKALCYNIFVNPKSNIIFYDNSNIFSFTSLLVTISLSLGIYDDQVCYINKSNYEKLMGSKKRAYILLPFEPDKDKNTIVAYAQENDICNLIIQDRNRHVNYNLEAIDKYFSDNTEKIKIALSENGANEYFASIPETIIEEGLLFNILKWIIS